MKSVLVAGFGGQGILFAGKQLALAGMYHDKKVTWLPSYGPEMRGGTANCIVVISENEIGSPVIPNPDIFIALNLPSFIKFEASVATNGVLICDSSLINTKSERKDIKAYYVPATAIANENQMQGLANVIMLGKLIAVTGLFSMQELVTSMEKSIPASKKDLLELNKKALQLGYDYAG